MFRALVWCGLYSMTPAQPSRPASVPRRSMGRLDVTDRLGPESCDWREVAVESTSTASRPTTAPCTRRVSSALASAASATGCPPESSSRCARSMAGSTNWRSGTAPCRKRRSKPRWGAGGRACCGRSSVLAEACFRSAVTRHRFGFHTETPRHEPKQWTEPRHRHQHHGWSYSSRCSSA